MSAETELGSELKTIQFWMVNDYYNLVVMIMARYEVDKSDTDIVQIMAKKVNSSMYAKMVIKHLNQTVTQHDLEELCGEISEIQRLTKATGASLGAKHNNQEKEVQLTSIDGKRLQGMCGH